MLFDHRLGCSTISFRHLELPAALATIADLGFGEIDLGALPGVCDHVPYVLDDDAVRTVADTVVASGLTVRSINGDIGDLNTPLDAAGRRGRDAHLTSLIDLAVATRAGAVVLPCGAQSHDPIRSLDEDLDLVADELVRAAETANTRGVDIWVESLHFFRLCWNIDRAQQLADRLADTSVGLVMDFSHIVASGGDPVDFIARFHPRVTHVHIRDAVPGDIHRSVGAGAADFAAGFTALAAAGYSGHFALELETRDITNDQRASGAVNAGTFVSRLL